MSAAADPCRRATPDGARICGRPAEVYDVEAGYRVCEEHRPPGRRTLAGGWAEICGREPQRGLGATQGTPQGAPSTVHPSPDVDRTRRGRKTSSCARTEAPVTAEEALTGQQGRRRGRRGSS